MSNTGAAQSLIRSGRAWLLGAAWLLAACGGVPRRACASRGSARNVGTVTGKFEGYTVERKRLGFVVVGTGSRRWASLYASPRKCGIPTLEERNPLLLAALRNFELSDWSMDGCGEEQIGIPDFCELAPVVRRVGEFLAENKLGERVSVEVAVDCLVQVNSPANSALEEGIGPTLRSRRF